MIIVDLSQYLTFIFIGCLGGIAILLLLFFIYRIKKLRDGWHNSAIMELMGNKFKITFIFPSLSFILWSTLFYMIILRGALSKSVDLCFGTYDPWEGGRIAAALTVLLFYASLLMIPMETGLEKKEELYRLWMNYMLAVLLSPWCALVFVYLTMPFLSQEIIAQTFTHNTDAYYLFFIAAFLQTPLQWLIYLFYFTSFLAAGIGIFLVIIRPIGKLIRFKIYPLFTEHIPGLKENPVKKWVAKLYFDN